MSMSVCTLGHGRAAHLANLVAGLRRQVEPPAELVVAVMQDEPYDLPQMPFPIRQLILGSGPINLSAARNAAADAARAEIVAFLDIDCIPDPDFISDYRQRLASADGLMMGEVLYLPAGATSSGIDYPAFERLAVKHSERAAPPPIPVASCSDYRCFWSLNFAMRKRRFLDSGGFDERYVGYGGEDTDFGRVVANAGIPLYWVQGARAFHQHHHHHMPPVHHVHSVLANARRFRDKWGEWTMPHWLRCFEMMELIERRGDDYVVIREPGADDLDLTRQQDHMPYASSARVMELLEARATSAASIAVA
ncbi:glycosyl transferase [Nostoc sp. 3335mG]|nr:glycosyl transferase [Nostoc sp. 3335mG]